MASAPYNATGEYQPKSTVDLPVLFAWPPRPLLAVKYLVFDMLFPWGYLFIGMAFLSWYFMPPLVEMAEFAPGWIAMIWLRNAFWLTLIAGGLHWWFYMRRGQGSEYKFHDRWLATDNKAFLWGDQVKDNVFWSIVSGVTICTAWEVVTWWLYANGQVVIPSIEASPGYFVACVFGVFFWGTIHFYLGHRLLHWQPLYKISHELHHRNLNTGPWTGVAMHPLEHLVYFSVFPLVWFVPVHPVIIILMTVYMLVGPAPSHSGFDYLRIGSWRISTGDWFHQLHHQYFNFNFGNVQSPFDWIFGSWHDGSRQSLQAQKERMRRQRRAA